MLRQFVEIQRCIYIQKLLQSAAKSLQNVFVCLWSVEILTAAKSGAVAQLFAADIVVGGEIGILGTSF